MDKDDPSAEANPTIPLQEATPRRPWWVVVVTGGGAPTVAHSTYTSALDEATRLSKKTGKVAYVMQAVSTVQWRPPKPQPLLVPVVTCFAVPVPY